MLPKTGHAGGPGGCCLVSTLDFPVSAAETMPLTCKDPTRQVNSRRSPFSVFSFLPCSPNLYAKTFCFHIIKRFGGPITWIVL